MFNNYIISLEKSEPLERNEIEVLGLLKKMVYEIPHLLLEGEDLDTPLKKSARLTFWIAVVQLIMLDVSIYISLTHSFAFPPIPAYYNLIIALLVINLYFSFVFLMITDLYSSRDKMRFPFITQEYPVYISEFPVYVCKSCNEHNLYSILEPKDLYHKIEYPEHKTCFASVEADVYKVDKFTDKYSLYEFVFITFYLVFMISLTIALYMLNSQYFLISAMIYVVSFFFLFLIEIIRMVFRRKNNSDILFLRIIEDYSLFDAQHRVRYYLLPLIITKRFLKDKELSLEKYPAIRHSPSSPFVYLISKIDPYNKNEIQVIPYKNIKPGSHNV